ncbi:CpsB/CapC family capsule biosynthesis tyrosine phosphatase [Bacillus sp. B1-b2]|uniref:CpsB/CapC family capsule biosynthesis tyrosine phosphatase n=1 Tax=Bacillus sp. B1-b2 TaxID=2653201 RepID=UPI001261A286|nr:CpsB/CapC family capsule biosynthesis tyrosine phosphatase [Bacillus sp. B1-b2]KAB7671736.1 hypothetical protein F9279_05295 [Bacillus sp. B1-b2]
MIDINCILFSDEQQNDTSYEKSYWMAKKSYEQGIHTIILPLPLVKEEERKSRLVQIGGLKEKLNEVGISMEIQLRPEIVITNGFIKMEYDNSCYIGNTHILMKLESSEIPPQLTKIIFNYHIRGYQIILSHPETNSFLLSNPDTLYNLLGLGVLVQISAASILGKNGLKIQKLANQLIRQRYVHLVATNAHSEKGLLLAKAYKYISKHYGEDYVLALQNNASRILENKTIDINTPIKIEKRILGIF